MTTHEQGACQSPRCALAGRTTGPRWLFLHSHAWIAATTYTRFTPITLPSSRPAATRIRPENLWIRMHRLHVRPPPARRSDLGPRRINSLVLARALLLVTRHRPPRISHEQPQPDHRRRRDARHPPPGRWPRLDVQQARPLDQEVEAQWAQVENAYQRRADLIPNLVHHRQGGRDPRARDPRGVTAARAQVGSLDLGDATHDAAGPAAFQAAQDQLSSALSRLHRRLGGVSRSSAPTRISSRCSRSSRAPRTASPSSASASTTTPAPSTPGVTPSRPSCSRPCSASDSRRSPTSPPRAGAEHAPAVDL
jgi:hypothetical protein